MNVIIISLKHILSFLTFKFETVLSNMFADIFAKWIQSTWSILWIKGKNF